MFGKDWDPCTEYSFWEETLFWFETLYSCLTESWESNFNSLTCWPFPASHPTGSDLIFPLLKVFGSVFIFLDGAFKDLCETFDFDW